LAKQRTGDERRGDNSRARHRDCSGASARLGANAGIRPQPGTMKDDGPCKWGSAHRGFTILGEIASVQIEQALKQPIMKSS